MYLGRRKNSEYSGHFKKFLNHNADPLKRLKSLKNGLEKMGDTIDTKQLLFEYSPAVFYVFYASFTNIESTIADRVNKGRSVNEQIKDLMETILPSLERLLIMLPEKFHDKWQYNSVCLVVRKLLHPKNMLELRQFGIKLILLWLQALQDNAGDASIELFASCVPGFPPKQTPQGVPLDTYDTLSSAPLSLCERYGVYDGDEHPQHGGWISTNTLCPIVVETVTTMDPALSLMEYLCNCLTSQANKLNWNDPSYHWKAFSFLFYQFKLFYLVCLYKNFRTDASLYCQDPPPLIELPTEEIDSASSQQRIKHHTSVSAVIKLDYNTSAPLYDEIRHLVLKFVLKWIMPGFHSNRPGSIRPKAQIASPTLHFGSSSSFTYPTSDLMKDMWFTSRDNIKLLFEIFHQGFKLSLSHIGVVNKMTELYMSWIQLEEEYRPLFMQQPTDGTALPHTPTTVQPWEVVISYNRFDKSDVRAGLQSSLRMMVLHTSQIFIQDAIIGSILQNQVDSCIRVIKLYQEIVIKWALDEGSWEYLLSVLLRLVRHLLQGPPPSNRDASLGGQLANSLLQTLLVSYVRANLVIGVSSSLWDQLQEVLSGLTQWQEVVVQWTDIMRSLTKCLARVLYHVDIDDPPLNKLVGSKGPRTRVNTLGAHTLRDRDQFTDIHVRPQSGHHVNTLSAADVRKFQKARTFDTPPSTKSTPSLKEDRRTSHPVMTTHSASQTHTPLSHPLPRKTPPVVVDKPDDVTSSNDDVIGDDDDDVIANMHIIDQQVPSTPAAPSSDTPPNDTPTSDNLYHNPFTYEPQETLPVATDTKDTVITNDDVSIASDNTRSSSVGSRPIRRSLSENLSSLHSSPKETLRPLSPDISVVSREHHRTFTEFVPSPPQEDSANDGEVSQSHSPVSEKDVQSSEGSWSESSTAIIWQRMLCILGDVNIIKDPVIHGMAMKCLLEVWNCLKEIEENLGISVDCMTTPTLPQYMPPLMLIFPWVVKACTLPVHFSEGRQIAHELLCRMCLRHTPLPINILSHYYHLMHSALQPYSDVLAVALKFGCKLLSYHLPGSIVLMNDCLRACTNALNATAQGPRIETLTLLGSMNYLLHHYDIIPSLDSTGDVSATNIKEEYVDVLFNCAISEPHKSSRCFVINLLGLLLYSELSDPVPMSSVKRGLDILLACVQFTDTSVVLTAIDTLTLLTMSVNAIATHYPNFIDLLLRCLAAALSQLSRNRKIKVMICIMLCMRDWLMLVPVRDLIDEGIINITTVNTVFKVLHSTVNVQHLQIEYPSLNVKLLPLQSSPNNVRSMPSRRAEVSSSLVGETEDQLNISARAILSHLLNLFGNFPFSCGSAQMTSVVSEHHDSPSLQYLNDLSTEIYDSPRVQFFSLNNSVIITVVEVPAEFNSIPPSVTTATYQCRIIIRDVTGKYCWDTSILYGSTCTPDEIIPSLVHSDSMESLHSVTSDTTGPVPYAGDLPSWQTCSHDDLLYQLLDHVERTSSECTVYPGLKLTDPAPSVNEPHHNSQQKVELLINQQSHLEQQYLLETLPLPCMSVEPSVHPHHYPSSFAFHHCRLFLSHMGFLSWSKRNSLELLEKNDQLMRELRHIDGSQTQSRQTYKVAVIYVSCGQEDKQSILLNDKGSSNYEHFVSGLGWEVNMEDHAGYMGGLNRTYVRGCSMPYYATSSEEVLFHVATRMPSANIEQKVRHLGNDEVHIVWSEHWRNYRRTIIKTQFADVLIVIYPISGNLYRIQIDKKTQIQFGPLYDGAVVDGVSLSALVRCTAINALRAQRSPLYTYRGRYQERARYIEDIMKMNVKSCFEDFAQSVMHPLETGQVPILRQSPVKATPSIHRLPRTNSTTETRWIVTNDAVSHKSSRTNLDVLDEEVPLHMSRPRSNTGEPVTHQTPALHTRNSYPDVTTT